MVTGTPTVASAMPIPVARSATRPLIENVAGTGAVAGTDVLAGEGAVTESLRLHAAAAAMLAVKARMGNEYFTTQV